MARKRTSNKQPAAETKAPSKARAARPSALLDTRIVYCGDWPGPAWQAARWVRGPGPTDLVSHASRGAIFETWVVSETLKNYHNRGTEPDIYFWRDSAGHEIDLLIDRGAKQIPIEVKSGQTIEGDFFSDVEYWRTLARQPDDPAGLVYGGGASYTRRRVSVVSWADWA